MLLQHKRALAFIRIIALSRYALFDPKRRYQTSRIMQCYSPGLYCIKCTSDRRVFVISRFCLSRCTQTPLVTATFLVRKCWSEWAHSYGRSLYTEEKVPQKNFIFFFNFFFFFSSCFSYRFSAFLALVVLTRSVAAAVARRR